MKFFKLLVAGALVVPGILNAQFGSIESIEYDPVNGRFLVSNGNNVQIANSAGNAVGQFGTEPKANYGMEVMGDALFTIISGGIVRAFDLTSGVQVSTITIPGTQFLNGMASDGESRIWVTDFGAKKVYEIDFSDMTNPQYEVIVANTVTTPNGICFDEVNNRLVFANWNSNAPIKAIDLDDYSVNTLVANTGVSNIDGIDNDSEGNFFISSWLPTARITKYNNDFSQSEIITVTGLSSPADICYAREIDTLAIPNSGNQTVKYVGFGETPSSVEPIENPFAFSFYPNPVTENSTMNFTLKKAAQVRIEILDIKGKTIEVILNETMGAAKHTVVPNVAELASGMYLWNLSIDGTVYAHSFVKQ